MQPNTAQLELCFRVCDLVNIPTHRHPIYSLYEKRNITAASEPHNQTEVDIYQTKPPVVDGVSL